MDLKKKKTEEIEFSETEEWTKRWTGLGFGM